LTNVSFAADHGEEEIGARQPMFICFIKTPRLLYEGTNTAETLSCDDVFWL